MKHLILLSLLLAGLPQSRAEYQPGLEASEPAGAVTRLATFFVGPEPKILSFKVENCAKNVKAVKLRVSQSSVRAIRAGVFFSDGSRRDFPINKSYGSGTESKWYHVGFFRAMDRRCAAKIFAEGHSEGGIARVEIFGDLK